MKDLECTDAGLADARIKERRVREFLEHQGLDALVIGRQDNFAWITSGGDSSVVATDQIGVGYIIITADHKWLVSYSMDGQRLIDEQVPQKDFELVTLYWHQGSPIDKILELTRGMKAAADFALPGARQLGYELTDLHYPFTDLELSRYEWIGAETNRIITEVALDLKPGVSEQDIAARFLYEYALAGMKVDVLIIGFDERISRYRHPMPTGKSLQRYAMLHPAVRRWGLHANVSRLVYFGRPGEKIQRAIDGVAKIGASVLAKLAPGVLFAQILSEEKRLYNELGYTEEWKYHFQGGITGYTLADPTRCLNPEAKVVPRQAYDYFITITGAKFEELTILTEDGARIASLGPGWPTRAVNTPRGDIIVPDVYYHE
jgi:Xaa-Pro dipeptidase